MSTVAPPTAIADLPTVAQLARQLRVDSIRATTRAGSGHPTSSMSAADILAVLIFRHLRYDWDRPDADGNDHLILSKGHASPLLYSAYKAVGVVSDEELMTGYRRLGSRLQGHPTPVLPWVDIATGSLGQGLPAAVGIALAGKYLDGLPFRVWVLCGDGEMAEGSVWEAIDKAAYYELSNLVVVIDVNRLGQRGPTELGWDLEAYARRVEAFGGRAVEVDGHDVEALDDAFETAVQTAGRPTVLVARTVKGRGFSEVENREGWHGRPFAEVMAARAIAGLGGKSALMRRGPLPGHESRNGAEAPPEARDAIPRPTYQLGETVATRRAYGDALKALGSRNDRIVALDGEVSNSTHTDAFAKAYPDRYFEMFIAEQQLIASAVGLDVRHYLPFASTFAAFLTRAYDFIRMAAVSQASICLVGSHGGVEIGADGPSQMGLEDLAMMRAVQGSSVFYPSDAVSTAALVEVMAETAGVSYLRTTRGAYPVLYLGEEDFHRGGSKILRSGPGDAVTLIGAGVTVHECLRAADELACRGYIARVIDAYSVKPIDVETLVAAANATRGRIVVAEDHHPEGGLGSAVADALLSAGVQQLRIAHLSVSALPGSGTPTEQLAAAGLDAGHIAAAAASLVDRYSPR